MLTEKEANRIYDYIEKQSEILDKAVTDMRDVFTNMYDTIEQLVDYTRDSD